MFYGYTCLIVFFAFNNFEKIYSEIFNCILAYLFLWKDIFKKDNLIKQQSSILLVKILGFRTKCDTKNKLKLKLKLKSNTSGKNNFTSQSRSNV